MNVEYRALGNTGLKVSEIGLGCEGFINRDDAFTDRMFALAFERGVNVMDLYSSDPDMQRRVGNAVRAHRDAFVLQAHLCSVWQDGQYKASRDLKEAAEGFETTLRQLGTSYADVCMIHYVDSLDTWRRIEENGILLYAQRLKQQGKARHIGLSSHNPEVALQAVNSGAIEVLMFSVNPCYDLQPAGEDVEQLWAPQRYEQPLVNLDPQRERLYETCQSLGVGITVMKAFGGGDLLTPHSPAGQALTVEQCIHYALTRPGVASVLCGARSEQELRASLDYETASPDQRDYAAAFATFPRISWKGHCMYCGHCAPCPQRIDVATVTKFLSLALAQPQMPETVREHYAAMQRHAQDCVECGACEKRCPFEVPIRKNMRKARETFGY